jgi:hypothetical protein
MAGSGIITQESGALRRRVAHLMDTVTFDPPGMRPSSILMVRRLADPLPRRLASHPEAVRADSEWERAARNKLGELHRRAARPLHGFVSGSADAVVFSDQSEMLACLARDLISGNAAMLWWWRAFLRTLPPGTMEALFAAWLREARYVPAALHLLHARGEAVRVLGRFSPTQAWSILQETVREFGISLPSPGEAQSAHVPRWLQDHGPANVEDERGQTVQQEKRRFTRAVVAPWHALTVIQAVPESLGRQRSALLGVSLLLHRAPQIVRTARFAAGFSAWYHHAEDQQIKPMSADSSALPLPPFSEVKSASSAITISPLSEAKHEESIQVTAEVPPLDRQMGTLTAEEKSSHPRIPEETTTANYVATEQRTVPAIFPPDRESGATQATHAIGPENPQVRKIIGWTDKEEPPTASKVETGPSISDLRAISSSAESQRPNAPPFHIAEGVAVPTELGGVLFLVNLLRALKLPELLETEFGVGPISGWDLLELLARSLLEKREPGLADDGLWTVLAELAGRSPGTPLAAEFQPQRCYRIPSFWMDAFAHEGAQVLGVRLRGSHLQLWHQDGFILADCLANRLVSRAAVERECRLYQRDEPPKLVSWRDIATPWLAGCRKSLVKRAALRRFIAFLLPYVRRRLCAALGLANAHALAETFLFRRGYLHSTRTHLDLTMSMNQATAQVRVAGLDADPGWMPGLGRVIKFSFVTEGWG